VHIKTAYWGSSGNRHVDLHLSKIEVSAQLCAPPTLPIGKLQTGQETWQNPHSRLFRFRATLLASAGIRTPYRPASSSVSRVTQAETKN
jgi:hypothetical protein